MTTRKKAATGESAASREYYKTHFYPRWINIAAITVDARTISTQVWVTDQQGVYDAERILTKWTTPDETRFHGKIMLMSMHDMHTKKTRAFKVRGEKVIEITDEMLIGGAR